MALTLATSILLGLGLAASCGFRTFLPLLMMGIAARLHLGGVSLNEHLAWVASTPSLVALGCATVVEFAADKIPIVDHGLHAVGALTRPAAGALAAAAAFHHADPTTAAVAGLILGAPTALAVHTGVAGARVASTATTAGLGNPVLSFLEDLAAFFGAAAALLAPLLIPLVLVAILVAAWALRRRRSAGQPFP